jgi:hypothetical protein
MANASEHRVGTRSALGGAAAEASGRLAEQIHTLSELTETLTYRLLDLEERLAAQEQRLEPLLQAGRLDAAEAAADLELKLGETQERMGRIEALLAGLERGESGRHLQGLQRPRLGREPLDRAHLEGVAGGEEHPDDPFYDEGEQPFMDERTA